MTVHVQTSVAKSTSAQALLVINSGSSSVKFAVYDTAPDAALTRIANGMIEGIGTQPRLRVWGPDGAPLEDRRIRVSANPVHGPEEAFEQLFDWLGQHANGRTLGRWATAWCMAARHLRARCASRPRFWRSLKG